MTDDINAYDIRVLKTGEEIVDGEIRQTGADNMVGVVVVQDEEGGPWRQSATPWVLTEDGPRHFITGEAPKLKRRTES